MTTTTANPAITTPATETTTHYRLTVESTPYTCEETGETFTTTDLFAVDDSTGKRFLYVGPLPCGTPGDATDIIARVFDWERRTGRTFSPLVNREYWIAVADPAGAEWPVVEVADTPSVWAKGPANVVEVVEVAPAPVKARKPRARKVDGGKARRAKACN